MAKRHLNRRLQKPSLPALAKEPETVLNSKDDFITIFGKIAGLVATLTLICSVIYDYGYFNCIGIPLAEIPISINDHLTSCLLWLPATIVPSALFVFLNIHEDRKKKSDSLRPDAIKQVVNAIISNKSFPAPKFLKLVSIPSGMIFVVTAFYSEIIPFILQIFIYIFCLSVMWAHFAWWLVVHPNLMRDGSKYKVYRYSMFVPVVAILLYGIGYGDAYLSQRASNTYNISLKSNRQIKGNILRSYEKFTFINFSSRNIVMVPQSEIVYSEKLNKPITLKQISTALKAVPIHEAIRASLKQLNE